MKNLTQYIFEALTEKVYNSVKIQYDGPTDLFIQIPENYTESDIAIYLDDTLLPKLPGSDTNKTKFFGINAQYISDRYFQYDSITLSTSENPIINIEFDSHYNQNINTDTKLVVYQIKNLKYILQFDKFILKNINDKNINDIINSLFKATESNINNKYPIELSLNNANITIEE